MASAPENLVDDHMPMKKCKMVSVFTSGYVNTETILHLFYKITDERGTKTMFTYAHVKWFYGQSERAYYLNYFIKGHTKIPRQANCCVFI